jgi:hypothetical protein
MLPRATHTTNHNLCQTSEVACSSVSSWYDKLRSEYTPATLRVLLIAESPPDPLGSDRRFFYSPVLAGHDNLFRGVALAAYGATNDDLKRSGKVPILRRLQADGFLLIDAVEYPVNHLPSSERRKAIRDSTAGLASRIRHHCPTDGVFVCSTPVFNAVAPTLAANGINVLNTEPAPFPLCCDTRNRFVEVWHQSIPSVTE